ncbi:ribonuclease H-like domain-containing protein [Tanacetum coccineum]
MFLSSLPPKWNTHVVVWMNKVEIETMSIDDLYNNFKIVEQKVKKSVSASSGAQNMAFMTTPSTSSTNDVNTAKPAYEVSTTSPNVNTANPQVSTASFSDNIVYAFMVENPNGSNLLQQDLEQIHKDDLEVIDLKWQLSLLCMRAKRYYQRTSKKIFINTNNTVGYDKSKVECFNCHKTGHFAKEYRAPKNKEGQFRNQDNTRKQGNNEDTSSKAMLAIDGVGFDWSDMAEEQIQTNMALMAFSNSKVYTDKTCSKNCLKNYETLKKQCDDLIVKLNESEFKATTYKRGLATLEDQIITYKKNEVLFSEEIGVLKRDIACKDYKLGVLKTELPRFLQKYYEEIRDAWCEAYYQLFAAIHTKMEKEVVAAQAEEAHEASNLWKNADALKEILTHLKIFQVNYKEALTQACWIEAMQEELHEFEWLEVWELVPPPDKAFVISLKWIYKVKLDELGGILKNKARLVARGYRQEEGIDFEESFAFKASK